MLKNYFKIAMAVLRRRKFFTFISLFGISFTLTILIVLTAFVDHLISAGYPDVNRSRELFINNIRLQNTKKGSRISGELSFYFFDHYVSTLKTPKKLAVSSLYVATNTYVNNKKLVINLKYTNDQYWDVLQYQFLEGKPYNKQQIDNHENLAVISEDIRDNYFGKGVSAVGKYIETDNTQYRVTGVVKAVPVTLLYTYSDIYVPYTLSKSDLNTSSLNGDYTGILLAASKQEVSTMKKEYNGMVSKIPLNINEYDKIFTFADTYFQSFIRRMPFNQKSDESGMDIFFMIVGILLLLFLLLPTLNLVNINISRIMERSSEIAVRKAFGASSKTLVYQFIVENLLLTFIGCLAGLVLSMIIILLINNSDLVSNMHLAVNITVLFYSLVFCFIFGLLSGVYPAWRMSRLQVVTALKAQ